MSDLAFPKQGKRKKKSKAVSKLQAFARGQSCTLRLPEICNGNNETVVLCHVKPRGHGAMGAKPSDIHGLHGCSSCHSFIDGGYVQHGWSREQVEAEEFRATIETQNRALEAELIKLVGVK